MYKNNHKTILLPTKEVSNIVLLPVSNYMLYNADVMRDGVSNTSNRHLYIIVDEALQENEIDNHTCIFRSNNELITCIAGGNYGRVKTIGEYYKIIATTDNTIYPKCDGHCATDECVCTYTQPTKEFIQYYIDEYNKGNLITDVEVEYGYTIDKSMGHFHQQREYYLKVNQDNTINIKLPDPTKVYSEADVKYFMDVAVLWGRNYANCQKDHYQFIRETLSKG